MSTHTSIFVGRQTQLEQLNNHWRDAFHKKQGKAVFLVGEAGIGKTSLIEQFSRSVLKNYSGVQYAYAQCDQIAGDISPYAPFVQILNSLTEQAAKRDENWFVAYMREVGPDVLGMVPVAGSLLTASAKSVDFVWQRRKQNQASEADRSQFGQQDLFQQFTDTFRKIATNKNPLLLCIDDWHWADTSSTNLLFHLARQLSDVPLLLLATYRPHDAEAREHPILNVRTEMERYSLCDSLELDFLSRADVESYLIQRFPKANFEPEFIAWLMQTTSGNALFTTEYLSLLLNEELLTLEGQLAGELADLQPPANVEAVIRTRLGYLDQEAREMLAYGSVEGEQFTTLMLSRLLEIKPLSLIRKLRAVEETHRLIASLGQQSVYEQQTTVYRFVHTLIYRTLYNMLETEERVEISRLLLTLLEKSYQTADQTHQKELLPKLISHAVLLHDNYRVARYALEAAQESRDNFAYEEMFKYCQIGLRAVERVPKTESNTEELRIELLLRQGDAYSLLGQLQQAISSYREVEALAEQTQDILTIFRALMGQTWNLRLMEKYDDSVRVCHRAIALAQQLDKPFRLAQAYHRLGSTLWKQHNDEEALVWAKKSLEIRKQENHTVGLANEYHLLGIIHLSMGQLDEAMEWLQQAIVINQENENFGSLAWNFMNVAGIYEKRQDVDQVIKLYEKAIALCEEVRDQRGQGIASRSLGRIFNNMGQPGEAMIWYQRAMVIWQKFGMKSEIMIAHRGLGRAYFQQENYQEAARHFYQFLAISEEVPVKIGIPYVYADLGYIYFIENELDKALDYLQKALTIFEKRSIESGITQSRQRIAEVEAKLAEQENKE